MKNNKMEDGLVSMTETLCDSLYVKELESRLETDPLVAGGLLQFMGDNGDLEMLSCKKEFSCGEFSCNGFVV
ncbi:MAG: hypothetical protein KHX27_10595 [Alistipes sp.]|jgi:hypothetical protein|uniref:hypothetical protein n=1 Tax=Alistipes TaxID=239759 RepID=UPI0022DF3750|nr:MULTISPECIES: hypothetical protein [Alistipes]MBS5556838.1 hypothetical protein [Alistipes sp.]